MSPCLLCRALVKISNECYLFISYSLLTGSDAAAISKESTMEEERSDAVVHTGKDKW